MNFYDIIITIYLIAVALGIIASLALGRRWWRPLLIVLVMSLAVFSLWWPGAHGYGPAERLKPGLDLAGGTRLVYDVSIPKGKNAGQVIDDTIAILSARVDPTGTRNLVWRRVAGDRIEIQMPLATAETGDRRRAYLDARDELLKHNLSKSALTADLRLTKTHSAQDRAKDLDALAAGNKVLRAQLRKLAALFDQLVAATQPYLTAENEFRQGQQQLDKLPSDTPKKQKAQVQAHVLDLQNSLINKTQAYLTAKNAYEAQLDKALNANITQSQLEQIFALNNQPVKSGQPSPRAAALKKLKEQHPARAQEITQLAGIYSQYEQVKGPLDDPQDLEQLLRGSGVLEFRIAASPKTVSDVSGYQNDLLQHGPSTGVNKPWRWFEIGSIDSFANTPQQKEIAKSHPVQLLESQGFVAAEYNGKVYMLLGNEPDTAMTRNEQGWKLTSASRSQDTLGGLAISFNLNPIGGERMGQITGPHVHMPMAILLDNKVISAPNLQSKIQASGQITGGPGGFSQKEETYLLRTLKAGSLEGQLGQYPISVSTTGPELGQDNLQAGLDSVIWSLVFVSLFMAGYYFFNGFVADLALLANTILILGVMAMINATFTLTGIAGMVLTIGMAVDANVLICERIREELDRKADVPTAVRLGYAHALPTIIDTHVTVLVTCVVLGYTASADVKGFAVTLGIGILASLFTALFGTHVMMDLYLSYFKPKAMRMLPTVSKTVHRILSPNFDWIGWRYVVMSFSAAAIIASCFLLYARGGDLFDIEFRSGTQVAFQLPDKQPLSIQTVRNRFNLFGTIGQIMDQPGPVNVANLTTKQQAVYAKLEPIADAAAARRKQAETKYKDAVAAGNTPNVAPEQPINFGLLQEVQPVTVGQTTTKNGETYAHEFSVATLITDPKAVSDVIKAAFPELKTTRPINFADMTVSQVSQAPVMEIVRVNPTTGKAILGLNINRSDVQNDVTDYLGGVAVVLENMSPAPTVADLTQRITRMAQRPAFQNVGYRQFEVIGINPAPNQTAGAIHYTSAVVVAHDSQTNYQENPQTFTDPTGLAATEWNLVSAAMQRDTSLASVSSFSSQVSGTMQHRALMALALALIAMVIYVWFRFGKLTYGLAALIALFHDVMIALGAVAISTWIYDNPVGHFLMIQPVKINLAVVAAILTIIGFSMNDTVVVFDRIRENRGRLSRATGGIINDAINQTFSRTVITSGTAMIAVVILYVIGGPGIHGFAYTMVVGVFVGTYSSIAIASPILLIRPMQHHENDRDKGKKIDADGKNNPGKKSKSRTNLPEMNAV